MGRGLVDFVNAVVDPHDRVLTSDATDLVIAHAVCGGHQHEDGRNVVGNGPGGLSQQPSSSDAQQRPSQTPAANPDGEPSPTDAPSVEPARITRQRVGLLDQFA